MSHPVAIVGAGITGLTAAYQLKKAGVPFVIYESGPHAGGVIRTIRKDGFLAECGPNTILETSPVIKELVQELGLASESIYATPESNKRYIVRGGKMIALPANPPQFFATKAFSFPAKLRLAREVFVPRRTDGVEETVADFVRRRIGREFLDYAINPFVSGIYAGDPEDLSVKYAFPKLLSVEAKYGSLLKGQFLGAKERKARKEVSKANAPKLSFVNGLQQLIDALGQQAQSCLKLESPVAKVRKEQDGWTVFTGGSRPAADRHSAVLLTAPAYALARMELENVGATSLKILGEVKYPAVATCTLGFRREQVGHSLDGFGVLIPEVEKFQMLGAIFASSVLPGRAPEGHVAITSFIGGCRNPALASLPADQIKALVLQDLNRLLGIQGQPVFFHLASYPKAIPQYNIGYGKFLEFFERTEKAAPGLLFAGNYRGGISLSDSIVSGLNAGEKAAQSH
ncbi:MAG: protoporphyrinogen oxidase, partial [Verrucomicrobiales bacterium]